MGLRENIARMRAELDAAARASHREPSSLATVSVSMRRALRGTRMPSSRRITTSTVCTRSSVVSARWERQEKTARVCSPSSDTRSSRMGIWP